MPAAIEPLVERLIVELAVPPVERVILVELNVAVGPEGDTDAEREMLPVNPPKLLSLIVELLEEPTSKFM